MYLKYFVIIIGAIYQIFPALCLLSLRHHGSFESGWGHMAGLASEYEDK